MAAFAIAVVVSIRASPQRPIRSATPIDRAFQRLYNFDFTGSLSILDGGRSGDPHDPLVPSVRAATYLFMELDRMKILETKFFMNDDNMVDGSSRPKPDPAVRAKLFEAFDSSKKLAAARLAADPNDEVGLFALSIDAGLETDYTALVEGRTWRSMKLAPLTLDPAKKLINRTPALFAERLVRLGADQVLIGNQQVGRGVARRYDGIEGDKRRGIEQVKLAARHGRYYGPFARILLAMASLREKKLADAHQLLAGLVDEYPENPLFRKELAVISDRMRTARR